jgi:hypothetical protein
MLSAIPAWLASQGAALVLGWLGRFLLDVWERYRAQKADSDLATARARLAQAEAVIAAQQAELQAQAAAPRTVGDAIARLEEGSA